MAGRDDQRDWEDIPLQRARQPLGPDGIAQRRSRPLQRPMGAPRGRSPQRGVGPASRGVRQGPGAGGSQSGRRPDDGARSRLLAVIVLLVAAVVVTIGGIVATTGVAGTGSAVSVSILPFPQSTDTTLSQ